MSSSSWQAAWDRAQERLASITDSVTLSAPRGRIFRVNQVDSELLDLELSQLLLEPLNKALGLVNVSDTSFRSSVTHATESPL